MARDPEKTPISAAGRLTTEDATQVFAALAQPTRLETYRLLLRYQPFGLPAGDIARLLAVPHNTLSSHAAILQAAGLVRSRREGRSIIYAADPDRFADAQACLYQGAVNRRGCQPHPADIYPAKRPEGHVNEKTYKVLILCTGNSARSILSEAIINREGLGRFHAYSAGSRPQGPPHPAGLRLLTDLGYDVSGLRSKSWSEYGGADAPAMDFIITVCDAAAGEACPNWPGHPLVAHWGIPDPAEVAGSAAQVRAAFEETYRRLMMRITSFVNLPVNELSLSELQTRLAEIGRMDGATEQTLTGKAA